MATALRMPVSTVLSGRERVLVEIVVMLATIMVVLDTTIANVALPHMQAALGATSESVAWVLTSYIVASAIAIPLTGWLSDRFGRKRLFTVAIIGFTISSAGCGLSTSLGMMVVARLFQGIFGAFIAPMSQAIMYDINPPQRHARAMMVWGMAVMIAPILGPTLGGYLTDQFDWRWVFFINLPIGVLTGFGAWLLVTGEPGTARRFDMLGFSLLGLALAAFQLMLDRGTQLDWFEAPEILIEGGVALGAAWMFIVHLTTGRGERIVPTILFKDRNYVAALIFIAIIGGITLAGAALIAPMLQRLLNYPVFDAGLMVMPRGIGTLIAFLMAGRLIERGVDGRMLIFIGLMILAASLWMMTGFSLDMDRRPVIVSGIVQGFGLGLTMMPTNLLAFTTLAPQLRTDAASLYSLLRNIGGSIAIAATNALVASNTQTSHADLGARINMPSLTAIETGLAQFGMPAAVALGLVDGEVNRQSVMIAYLDDYWLMMWATIVAAPLVMMMRRQRAGAKVEHVGE